jgi:hypothetical protein
MEKRLTLKNHHFLGGMVRVILIPLQELSARNDWTYIWTVSMCSYDLTILWKLPDSVNLFE